MTILAFPSAYAADPVQVTADNYVRAESDFKMKSYIDSFGNFGKFHHYRQPYDVNNQVTVRGNRDTLYSEGVFDLTSPVRITLPETGGRYQSLMVVSQDHSIWISYVSADTLLELSRRTGVSKVADMLDPIKRTSRTLSLEKEDPA